MFERFAGDSRRAVVRALDVARRQGAAQVEPEHLLLALAEGEGEGGSAGGSEGAGEGGGGRAGGSGRGGAGEGGGAVARALAEAGLTAQAIADAIEQDLVAALEVVGVPASVVAATPAQPRADNPGFGVATKQALERSLREAVARGDRRIATEHLLLGLLGGPRANVARETTGADHRQAVSSDLDGPEGHLRSCVLAWRRRHPGVSRTTFTRDPLDTPAVSIARLLARLDVQPSRLAALVQVEMASRR